MFCSLVRHWSCCRCCVRFTFELDVDHNVEMFPVLTMKAKHGIKLIFTERH